MDLKRPFSVTNDKHRPPGITITFAHLGKVETRTHDVTRRLKSYNFISYFPEQKEKSYLHFTKKQ